MSAKRLEGKIAIVTGCGSSAPGWGNGKATAVVFAREGATVIGTDANLEAAEETRKIIESEGGRAFMYACDALDSSQVRAFVEKVVQQFGRIDILVNNIGASAPGGPVEISEEMWDAQFNINVKSAYLACKFVLPVMERQGKGAVVNTGSISAHRYTGKHQVAYSASKAGLVQFTRATAVMYAPKGIRLNTVIPGLINTGALKAHADRYGVDYDAMSEGRNKAVPMLHMGDAWDVAYASLYLASDEAKYITGMEIPVDGGIRLTTGMSY
ncbi:MULTISPECIES: SDR family NAD(P)-dependent oxidoreductase [unclassified Variovorax]|uniref:SDR family NAD(P)-dependent oxidoreductase n=1 Tax=unclassified Variovorax TaxID=663243 RepID=UPI001BD46034|nr:MULTISPECIES: SDR family NAD(P)-dependent oxidoreductase [unclassified Variovorax]